MPWWGRLAREPDDRGRSALPIPCTPVHGRCVPEEESIAQPPRREAAGVADAEDVSISISHGRWPLSSDGSVPAVLCLRGERQLADSSAGSAHERSALTAGSWLSPVRVDSGTMTAMVASTAVPATRPSSSQDPSRSASRWGGSGGQRSGSMGRAVHR